MGEMSVSEDVTYSIKLNTAGEFIAAANWELGPRVLEDWELVYFPSGSGTLYTSGGVTFELAEPCFVMTRKGEEHVYRFDRKQPVRHLFVHFEPGEELLEAFGRNLLAVGGVSVIPAAGAPLVPVLLRHILQTSHAEGWQKETRCGLLLAAMLHELGALLHGERLAGTDLQLERMTPVLEKALQFIDAGLTRTDLSVSQIAEHVGWTHEHLTRRFKSALGMSPRETVLKRRLERSCQLLIQTDDSIKRIAYEVGFSDEHYFSRAFVKHFGIVATQYRAKYANLRYRLAYSDEPAGQYPLNRYFIYDYGAQDSSQ